MKSDTIFDTILIVFFSILLFFIALLKTQENP